MKRKSGLTQVWAAALLLAASGTAGAQSTSPEDIAKGKRLYMACAACHDIGDTGPARIGPHLKGLLGRTSASVTGFKYSPAMKAKPFVWDEKALDAWLTKPADVVPGNTMPYGGMPNPADRKALIAYLATLK